MLVGVAILLVVTALAAGLDGAGSPTPGAFAPQPRLTLAGTTPVAVRGAGFHARERVRLVFHQPAGNARRRATAGAHGTFSATFGADVRDRCSGFWISATGSAGSRTRLIRRAQPECPSP
jgi:hypothetical protein